MKSMAMVLLLIAATATAGDTMSEVVLRFAAKGIDVAPDGSLWIGTTDGELWRSTDGARTWSEAPLPSRRSDPATSIFNGDTIDRVTFFDAGHAMVTGYIGKFSEQIFITADGGATWRGAALPRMMWVYDARAASDGHAWLAGSGGEVMRSDDFGATWTALPAPFGEGERTMSVDFRDADHGVVGALSSGAIAITNDGGTTWDPFHAGGVEEIVPGCAAEHDRRVTRVRLTATKLVIAQCGGVFASPLAAPRKWMRVTAAGQALVHFDVADNGDVVGIARDLRVYRVGADGAARAIGGPLERMPMTLATSGKFIAAIDTTAKVAFYDGAAWTTSRMLRKGAPAPRLIKLADRGKDGALWGASQFFLYKQRDGEWTRVAELPRSVAGMAVQPDGDVLLWDGATWVAHWKSGASSLDDVPSLGGLAIAGSFRRPDLWLVYGLRPGDDDGEGIVAASADGGATWTTIDRWLGEDVQQLFLSDDNELAIVSSNGSVRRGSVTRKPLAAKMQTLVDGQKSREHAPYAQFVTSIDFLRPNDAWISVANHHMADAWFHSTDGGRTWNGTYEEARHPVRTLLRLYDGTWIGITAKEIQRWNGERFERVAAWPADAERAWVDGAGGVSMRMEDGSLARLERQPGGAWSVTRSSKR